MTMHATDFYASTCRFVMQADPDDPATLSELRRLLPCLRQALGCYVCFNLLKDPMSPDHNVCRHSVCTNCLGGKMKLKPACSWCKDYWDFVPNPLMKVLVSCYKKLCLYIDSSPLGQLIRNDTVNGEVNHLLQILSEGMHVDDSCASEPCLPQTEQTGRQTFSTVSEVACTSKSETVVASTSKLETEECSPVVAAKEVVNDLALESEELVNIEDISDNEDTSECATHSGVKHNSNKQKSMKTKDQSDTNEHKVTRTLKSHHKKRRTEQASRTILHKKSIKKSCKLKSSFSHKKNHTKMRLKVKKFNNRNLKTEEPSELERIDNLQPPVKKVKVELSPPELKPLSLCNCGKSSNYNQLTCIGQRCPCYSMKLPCIGCKCRGCRNPKKGPDYQSMATIGSSAVLRSGTRNTSEYMYVNS